jgi:type I restriction enzyme, S subunit
MQKAHQMTAYIRPLMGCCISINNLPYEKIGKNEPVCIADEVPFEIPDSWEWVTLKQIAVSELGKTLDKVKNTGDYRPYLCSINVYWTGIDLSKVKEARFDEAELDKYRLQKGDLLICEGGDVGRAAVWNYDEEMFYQNALHRVRFYGGISPDYFKLVFECYKGNKILDECSKGMTIKHLVQSALNAIYFPLPPITEQHRILSKMAELSPFIEQYARSEKGLSSLNTVFPDQLKKSILQYAVQGKLVPQDPNDEPASVLLERIRAEKEQLIKAGKIKRDKHESVIIRRDNSYYEKVDGIERCIDDEIPFDVPESWGWCRLENLCKSIADGDHQAPPKTQSGIPFLVISNVSTGTIDFASTRFVSIQYFENLSDSRKASTGDLLFTVTGSYGIVVPVTSSAEFCFQRHIALIKPLLNQEFLVIWLKTPLVYEQCSSAATGTAQKTVGLTSLKGLLIPVPPLAEQQRIVAKINEILPALTTL